MNTKNIIAGFALAAAAGTANSAVISIESGSAAYLSGVENAFQSSLADFDTYGFETWDNAINALGSANGSGQQNQWIEAATTFETEVGNFTLTNAGQGGGNTSNTHLMIESSNTGEYGRQVLSENANDYWLDSNDADQVEWLISTESINNAFGFYLADVNDQGARLQLSYSDGSSEQIDMRFSNASLFYATIYSDVAITGATLYFNNCRSTTNCTNFDPNDGWGIDDITVGVQVPEPSTLALLGLGLLGLGAARRRAK